MTGNRTIRAAKDQLKKDIPKAVIFSVDIYDTLLKICKGH